MRRLTALAVLVAIATLVPMVAWASLASGSCCAAEKAPKPMACCKASKCSMSTPVPVPVAPKHAEATQGIKVVSPGPAVIDAAGSEAIESSSRDDAGREALPRTAVPVDRRLALLSTYLI